MRRLFASARTKTSPGKTARTFWRLRPCRCGRSSCSARARHAEKRGGQHAERITLDESVMSGAGAGDRGGVEVLELDAALNKLAELDPQQAQIVELRYFGGLTVEEAAEALDISPATVKRHWTLARAFLKKELSAE
jgi:RNA polymerase sigma factor (TIGR02999 family)